MSNRVLIIGASGFLGQRLYDGWKGADLVGTCFQHRRGGLLQVDLRQPQEIFALLKCAKPSLVLYAAGLTDVDACEQNQALAMRLNEGAVSDVLKSYTGRFIYFSTDYVFDGATGGYPEDAEPNPINFYGRSKLAGERIVLRQNYSNAVIRVSGLYSNDGVKGRQFASSSRNSPPLESDDTRFSSPVHVDDVLTAVLAICESQQGGVFHVGGENPLSRYEFNQIISLYVSGAPDVRAVARSEQSAKRPFDTSLRSERIKSLGWRASPIGTKLQKPIDVGPDRPSGLMIDCVGGLLTTRSWLSRNAAIQKLADECGCATGSREFWLTAAKLMRKKPGDIPAIQQAISRQYAPNPPIWRMLRKWRSKYRLALVNNGTSGTFRCWVQKYELEGFFDTLANSEELTVAKPDAQYYKRVAAALGLAPQKCALIDDSITNVSGAHAIGMRAFLTVELFGFPLSGHAVPISENLDLS